METSTPAPRSKTDRSRAPQNSLFFEKMVPVLLIGMGVITALLILFAAGVLLGIVRF